MKAKDFVLQKFPDAYAYPMIDNYRRRTSYIIMNGAKWDGVNAIMFPNEGATTASKAWTNAKKHILTIKP